MRTFHHRQVDWERRKDYFRLEIFDSRGCQSPRETGRYRSFVSERTFAVSEESTERDLKLLQVLINEKLISAAQADLAKSDGAVSGMTVAEVLLARRWVNEQTLDRVAPWLKEQVPPAVVTSSNEPQRPDAVRGDSDYQQNLKVYRQLMHKILDE